MPPSGNKNKQKSEPQTRAQRQDKPSALGKGVFVRPWCSNAWEAIQKFTSISSSFSWEHSNLYNRAFTSTCYECLTLQTQLSKWHFLFRPFIHKRVRKKWLPWRLNEHLRAVRSSCEWFKQRFIKLHKISFAYVAIKWKSTTLYSTF